MAERLAVFGVLALSSLAGSTADSLCEYADLLPDSSRDIRSVVKCLYDIRATLRDLDLAFQDHRFNRLARELLDDIVLGIGSCSRSLRELDNIVARYTSGRRVSSPRRTWQEVQSCFLKAEGFPLGGRLDVHRTFLLQLKGILQYKSGNRTEMSRLREEMKYFAANQERVAKRMRDLEESQRRAAEEKAYMARYPPTPPYGSPSRRSSRSFSPVSPPHSAGVDPVRYMTPADSRPVTPMAPNTPTTPISPPPRDRRYAPPPAPTPLPPSPPGPRLRGGNVNVRPDWWVGVFDGTAGSTGFANTAKTAEGSQCFGMPMDTLNMAREEIEIIKVEFDNDLTLRLYRDETTEAAKVVCTVGQPYSGGWVNDRRGHTKFQTFIDASLLTVSRAGSSLHLKRRGILWACLYFADIENMVLFYHTFLALRSNGPKAPTPKKSEYWLDGEELLFSGEIDDEGYPHILRVLQDRDSGVVRLASANVKGEQTDVTIWTAFITDYIGIPDWLRYSRSNSIILRDLRQFSFSVYFDTNTWKNYELRFKNPGDARAFERVIKEIRLPTYSR